MYFKSGSYTGDGVVDRVVSGIGFQPDVVIVKRTDTGALGFLRTASMASGSSVTLRGDSGITTNVIKTFNSDGFTVGTADEANTSGAVYTYSAWKDSGAGDFAYGTYTGDGTTGRSLTLQATFPFNWLVIKGDLGRTGAFKNKDLTGDKTHAFYSTGTNTNQITATMSTSDGTVTLGSSDFVNNNGSTYYWFGTKQVAGQSFSSTYTGNGTDNTDITAPGFLPSFVWIKREDSGDLRFRNDGHSGDNSQSMDGGQQTNEIQSFISTGFDIGTGTEVNNSGSTNHYVAYKQNLPSAPTTPHLFGTMGVGV